MAKAAKKTSKKVATEPKAEQAVQKLTPSRALSPFEEMDRLMESFFPRRWHPMRMEWPSWSELAEPFGGRMPKVDIIDKDTAIVVHAEVPGVNKKDLDISLTEDTVTIKGSTSQEQKEEKEDYYRSEISRDSFSRTLPLPCEVDGAKAKAKFKDGVLELTLPKVKKTKRRSVTIE
jgi:HSP20 family protein